MDHAHPTLVFWLFVDGASHTQGLPGYVVQVTRWGGGGAWRGGSQLQPFVFRLVLPLCIPKVMHCYRSHQKRSVQGQGQKWVQHPGCTLRPTQRRCRRHCHTLRCATRQGRDRVITQGLTLVPATGPQTDALRSPKVSLGG